MREAFCIFMTARIRITRKNQMQKILYFFLLVSLSAHGQTSTDKIKPVIDNAKTSQHVNVPGTRLYIIPPPGFKTMTNFTGLQKGETSMVQVYDLVGGNFYKNAADFTKARFEKDGINVFDYQEIKVNGYPAKYIAMQSQPAAKTYAMVFGDTSFSTMIMAACPATDAVTDKEIINSLNTICYDKNKKIDPFETANFSLDEKVSRFKFFRYNINMYIYMIDGVEDTEDKNAPGLIVMQLPKDNTNSLQDIANIMIGKYALANQQIKNSSFNKINDYDAYETEVYGEVQGNTALIYLCVVAKDDKAIVVQGIAKKDLESNLQEFKKLAHTIKMK